MSGRTASIVGARPVNDTDTVSRDIDVNSTRRFGTGQYFFRKIPFALGFMALGILVLYLSWGGSGDDDQQAKIAAVFIIFACLVYIGFAFHWRDSPRRAMLELSPAGILLRIAKGKDLQIPWSEVQDLVTVDIKGPKNTVYRDITAVLVSQDFFDAHDPVKSWWGRGPGWRYHFDIRDDGTVQIAFHHDLFSIPADELWQEIEARWRAFSGSPDAPLLATPRIVQERGWILGWKPTQLQQRALLTALAVAIVAGIYFRNYLYTRMTFPNLTESSASYYLPQVLDGIGVHARLPGKGVVVLHRYDVLSFGLARCKSRIVRDPQASWLSPSYTAFAICSTDAQHISGAAVTAIFKLTSQTFTSKDWQDKPVETKAIWPAEMSIEEADARLCELGSCGDA